VHTDQPGDVRCRHCFRHHQHRLRPTNDPLLRLRRPQGILDPSALFGAQNERYRRTTHVRSPCDRAVVDHAGSLHHIEALGQKTGATFAARH
jgi:hypothetical protein